MLCGYGNIRSLTSRVRISRIWVGIMLMRMAVWEVAAEDERNKKDGKIAEQAKLMEEMQERKRQMKQEGIKPMPGGSL